MRSNLAPSTSILSIILYYSIYIISIPRFSQYVASAALLDQCTVSVAALFTDPRVNACIPITPTLQLLNGTELTPKLVNDTATTFCEMPFCGPSTVSLMENTINQNCANNSDEMYENFQVYNLASLYVPLKQGTCQRIQDPPTNGTFCITVLVDKLQEFDKKHPNKRGWGILDSSIETREYFNSIPNEVICTKCNQAMINPLNTFVSVRQLNLDPAIVALVRTIQDIVQGKCGQDFIQTIPPPQPSVTTATASRAKFFLWTNSNHIPFWSIPGIVVIISIILL